MIWNQRCAVQPLQLGFGPGAFVITRASDKKATETWAPWRNFWRPLRVRCDGYAYGKCL
ncbi:hypothetical protein MPL3356_100017 [Mesorhizobium plurifarium]|uniref:Uncharacterized protein n=1 Tax=Mesorhizobium plurifarium TaxID=69974 RepID=A0A090DEK6_MESPL|nr:hypothetical protein MPL3356_100017 [Mesorhizobium plurifarium]